MNIYKKIIKYLLLAFVVFSASYLIAKEVGWVARNGAQSSQNTTPVQTVPDGVTAYYFHGDRRCMTCRTIEAYLHEALNDKIREGKVKWSVVNVQEAGNNHFIYDFDLSASSAVLARYKGGKVVNWKDLSQVWKLVRDKPAFFEYINNEVASFLKQNG